MGSLDHEPNSGMWPLREKGMEIRTKSGRQQGAGLGKMKQEEEKEQAPQRRVVPAPNWGSRVSWGPGRAPSPGALHMKRFRTGLKASDSERMPQIPLRRESCPLAREEYPEVKLCMGWGVYHR